MNMQQPTLAMKTINLFTHNSDQISNTHKKAKVPISIFELEFQTESLEHKRIECPKNGAVFLFNFKEGFNCKSPDNEEFNLGSLQSLMLTPDQSDYIDLFFPKNGDYQVFVMSINKLNTMSDFKDEFSKDSLHTTNKKHFWFTGLPNVKLSNFVNELMSLESALLNNMHLRSGYINIIIGSKMAEFEHYNNAPKKQVDLRNDEIESIHKCINYIKENYAQQLDLELLCTTVSLSPQKLQTGFRELYGNTVNSFIKNFRLEKAEELMRTTELNVSEIVYSIGLTSRSYFSKIFKEKFETSPNDYIKKFKFQLVL